MPWQSCEIILNSGSTSYFNAGDIITGTVVVKFEQKQKIEHFGFEVTGISKASWTRPMPTIPYIKTYSETRIVLSIKTDIFAEIQGKAVAPGIYTHPFYFALPPDLPSSFKSSIAKVFYYIKVQSKVAFKFKKKTFATFNVMKNVDLNHLEEFLQIEYNVSSGYLKEEKKVARISFCEFKNEEKELCTMNMIIPPTNPTSNYSMIKIEYKFLVNLDFLYHFSLCKDIPVKVSTVPVMHAKLFA